MVSKFFKLINQMYLHIRCKVPSFIVSKIRIKFSKKYIISRYILTMTQTKKSATIFRIHYIDRQIFFCQHHDFITFCDRVLLLKSSRIYDFKYVMYWIFLIFLAIRN